MYLTIYCQVWFINTRVVDANPPIMMREMHLKVRSGEHIRISTLTFKKLYKMSSKHEHLLQFDNNPSFDEFTILTQMNKKYLLKIKESPVTLPLFDTV